MYPPLLSPHMWGNPTYKNKIELSHPMRLTDEAAASHGNDNSSISTTNIQKILDIDKVVPTHVGGFSGINGEPKFKCFPGQNLPTAFAIIIISDGL